MTPYLTPEISQRIVDTLEAQGLFTRRYAHEEDETSIHPIAETCAFLWGHMTQLDPARLEAWLPQAPLANAYATSRGTGGARTFGERDRLNLS